MDKKLVPLYWFFNNLNDENLKNLTKHELYEHCWIEQGVFLNILSIIYPNIWNDFADFLNSKIDSNEYSIDENNEIKVTLK